MREIAISIKETCVLCFAMCTEVAVYPSRDRPLQINVFYEELCFCGKCRIISRNMAQGSDSIRAKGYIRSVYRFTTGVERLEHARE